MSHASLQEGGRKRVILFRQFNMSLKKPILFKVMAFFSQGFSQLIKNLQLNFFVSSTGNQGKPK